MVTSLILNILRPLRGVSAGVLGCGKVLQRCQVLEGCAAHQLGRKGHWRQLPPDSSKLPTRDGRGKSPPATKEGTGRVKEKCGPREPTSLFHTLLSPGGGFPGGEVEAEERGPTDRRAQTEEESSERVCGLWGQTVGAGDEAAGVFS